MSSFRDKEKSKEQQEKFQAILSALLKDEDNKYCVDCDAKGPRWASWNLGIFLCIRCAGIHRNLGVHISKVKSVNLDTWTPEQVAMMQEIGNSRGRAVYEANIPDGFRRPHTDSAMEPFIRSKYEHKKYIAREWIPPQPKVPKELNNSGWLEDSKAEKKRARAKAASAGMQIPSLPKAIEKPSSEGQKAPAQKVEAAPKAEPTPAPAAPSNDLLGLDFGASQPTNTAQQTSAPAPSHSNELLELFGAPQPAPANAVVPQAAPQPAAAGELMNGASAESTNLFGGDGQGEEKKSAKDSIMALFGGGGGGMAQPQMYGVPGGVYMPQGQQQMYQQQGMVGQPQQNMMANQQNMMAQPQQNMMANQQNMMGQQQNMMGQTQQGIMGQQQGMMGQQQGMMGHPQQGMMAQGIPGQPQGMMGHPQGMMGHPQGMMPQGMYNGQGQMMAGAPNQAMYNPQQMQQLQFQQMQQQMTAMKLNGGQMSGAPAQQWGAQAASGHTLSNNLWQ